MAGPQAASESSAAATASFGYWVRRRRLALDLTQAELARSIHCATITIAKIERDERRPSRQMAALLADHLAVPPDARGGFIAAALGELAPDRLNLDPEPLLPPPAAPAELPHGLPTLAAPAQPLHSLPTPAAPAAPPSSLPTPATPFVGRRAELERLAATLADPACRLLTLLGAGGFGKTRLAIRLGELFLAHAEEALLFPDGVFFVPLDGLAGGELVVGAVAGALAFTFYAQEDQEQQLLRYLAPKRLLLILDNAEEILEGDLVLRLLAAAPGVKLLVTSRTALSLQQEWLHPIGGMAGGLAGGTAEAEEGEGALPQGSPAAAAAAGEADAVVLFRQSALRVQPTFDLHAELPHVQQICRLVEGAPLAIELAAAWLKALPCAEVARELARSIDLLTTAMRDVPPRHRSMRAVLEQSWDLLTADEQAVFRRLAVFAGGFRLEAAQAVTADGFAARLPLLAALVEKAMLQLLPGGRYRVHALLRGLGAEHLEAAPAELAACRDRHAAYYLAFVAARRAALGGPGQLGALGEIQEELDNIRAAWAHAAARGHLEALHDALWALFGFLWMRGRYAEGEQMARQALESSAAAVLTPEEQRVRIALAAYAAQFAGAVGAHDRALPAAQAALDAALRSGDAAAAAPAGLPPGNAAYCYYALGLVQAYAQAPGAIANLRAAYDAYRAHDDAGGTAEAALKLGFYLWAMDGDHALASALVEESLAGYRTLGDAFGLADALDKAAILRWYAGDVPGAEALYRESLQTARTMGNELVALQATGGFAFVALARGQWDAAIELAQERLALAERLGHDYQVKHSLAILVTCYVFAERFPQAVAILEELPGIWHTADAPLAYVGIGAYAQALAFLRRPTAELLEQELGESFLAVLLLGWAALLQGDCMVLTVRDPAAPHILAPDERHALIVEVLTAVHPTAPVSPVWLPLAARLLAKEYAKAGEPPSSPPAVRPVRELAREMLALQLG